MGSGPTDIGIHLDQYGCDKTPVDTYFTMATGRKIVIMLPPTVNKESFADWFDGKAKFPEKLTKEHVRKIIEAGGFYFDVAPAEGVRGQVTLFVPKGWHHWLLGMTKWAVIFGSSAF